jgi:natural product biosynthesis luciferase-like monooxygenase protein
MRIAQWANTQGVAHLGGVEGTDLRGMAFDYLFSVANLSVLPEQMIAHPRRGAINFHDGPLPERSGLNTPAWAIIEGRQTHAVSWHEMTAAVDAGGVLATRAFPILPGDTAFSLNARCFEAGVDSFAELLRDLVSGQLGGVPQTGTRVWYGRSKRPQSMGVLDFSLGGADLDRLVRGLDFGPYVNPLGLPKLWTGQQMIVVRHLERATGQGVGGQVLAVDAASLDVAVADGAVRLSGLSDLWGRTVDPQTLGLAPGQILPGCPPLSRTDLAAVGKDEALWEADLVRAAAALPAYPHRPEAGSGNHVVPLDLSGAGPDTIVAAWLAWVAGLGGLDRASVALCNETAPFPALSALRLVTLDVVPDATAAGLTADVTRARLGVQARLPMAADLGLRLADPEARETALQALRVVIGAHDVPLGADLSLRLDTARMAGRTGIWDAATLAAMARDFGAFLAAFKGDARLADLPLGQQTQAGVTAGGQSVAVDAGLLHDAIARIAGLQPDAVALEAGAETLTYAELEARADAMARALAGRGAGRGSIVGLCLERSADLVIAMLAILKCGAAYLPLDPDYPAERIAFMIADAACPLIVASSAAALRQSLDPAITVFPDAVGTTALPDQGSPDDLAYLIYTSGSTGRPKGVMIPHRAVGNFLAGMDGVVPLQAGARLLAVTSVSFDISVLEIFWTLARGATLVLQTDAPEAVAIPEFSLFYFASEAAGTGHHAYRLLLEGARFADANGFAAIWTPERHFHAFGGLYPNPAISSAALTGITKNVKLRAGSSVAPLHHPVQVAEDWALVDNLSNGRAGMAIASGWQPNDFVLRPEAFADRKDRMLEAVATMRRLWNGEKVAFPGPDGKLVEVEIHPKPMQAEMPLWLTAAGNPETFAAAARLGCGVLTHLLGQSFEELSAKISAYRAGWKAAGHKGQGHVVLMLHTFVGEDEDQVRATARGPMKGYLKSAVDLVRRAAWTFPTIVNRAEAGGVTPQEMFEKEDLSEQDLDALLDHAFERYYRTSGLFGTAETAADIVRDVAMIGVDEVACLIDFGIDTDVVLANLPNIKALMDGMAQGVAVTRKASVAEDIGARGITHLQCTPSMAAMLVSDTAGQAALGQLSVLMVGGEAFPPDLARRIRAAMPNGVLLNMYGPTETTIWSSVARLDSVSDRVPLGAPILNTDFSIRSPQGRAVPDLVAGELWIGGAGVAQGYWARPDLTAERFVDAGQHRFYRTGDLVRRAADGTLEFLGRIDNQVKIRGHRIELGEIEAALAAQPGVAQAVVRAVEFGAEDKRLLGYVTVDATQPRPVGATLRAALVHTLPEIMVPSQIVVLDRMPMTPNGKIDRKALPVPGATLTLLQGKAGPPDENMDGAAQDGMEALIAGIWGAALGLDSVSVTDNFFDLGGHSLLVVQVQRQMKERLARDIAITDLFRFPTIRSLAGHLQGNGGTDAGNGNPSAADRGAARAAVRLARLGRR